MLSTAGELQTQSGRWLKLTKESAALVRSLGPSKAKADKLMTGVVRTGKGRIFKHLKFEKAGLLTPAAPIALGAMATQMALDAAMEEITTYLVTIDAKLDRLLKQRKTETLGSLGGVALAIDEAHAIYAQTGTVSSTTWSKIQANSTALATMQAEAIAQLASLAKDINEAGHDPDRLAVATSNAKSDVPFWLGILGHAMVLENKQYILELARVADAEMDQLEAHRQGIAVARGERMRRIRGSLIAIEEELHAVAGLPNLKKVTNPFRVSHIVDDTNHVNREVAAFAASVELEGVDPDELLKTPWGEAVRVLVGDGAHWAAATSANVVEKVRVIGQQIEESRDEAILEKAAKVHEKREARRRGENSGDEPA